MSFFARLKNIFTVSELDEDFYEELEEALILSDVGMDTTEVILDGLKRRVRDEHVKTTDECRELLKELIRDQMSLSVCDYAWESEKALLLVVGVNGVGKTTSIGKLAMRLKEQGRKPVLVAADTFRAGAAEQLEVWAKRTDSDCISQHEGADPASVLFDGIQAAKARKADVILCDTAGRLHNKKNLMDELRKMNRIAEREAAEYKKETLMVLDATTGQNALNQAREFLEATEVSGIILTKLDGTAKGGVVLAIQQELGLPIAYIGVGEGAKDLKKFDPSEFAEEMFAE